ncbi:TIR domain-containing protein [Peribacillus butanolivorans]|uniref:TIR domain-containing protein n=1 Tax=Peribacillus butanolivorans TaxID=421767 RepID=UPI00367A90B2
MSGNEFHLLSDLINRTESLTYGDEAVKDSLNKETEMFIRNVFPNSEYKKTLSAIRFYPISFGGTTVPLNAKHKNWESGKSQFLNLLNTMKKELEWFRVDTLPSISTNERIEVVEEPLPNKVFIVHGHDDSMKLDVARTIEKIGLEAVILHEQDNLGLTVIEKFENNAINCNFAVVLLSPDDKGYPKNLDLDNAKFRARQNVVLELGYFLGRLGRSKVLPLVKNYPTDSLEIPSDLAGIVYTPYDASGAWKMNLVRSLKLAGYNLDANDLFI